MIKVALFASGSGTNVENIARFFQGHKSIKIAKVYSNKKDAYVLERAKKLEIPAMVFNRQMFYESQDVLKDLKMEKIDWVVLAGFLWLIPSYLIQAYPNKVVNIHPALLPKYGGKGMYGDKVHQAVVANKETESGITIHYVNEEYDKGSTIFQEKIVVLPTDSPDDVAHKVHALEYAHFPKVIQQIISGQ